MKLIKNKLIVKIILLQCLSFLPLINMSCSNNLSHITDSEVKGVLNSLSFDYGKKLIEDIKDEVNGYVDYINKTKPLNFNEIYIEANNEKFKINNKEPIKQLNSKIIDLHNDFIDKKTTIKNHVQHTINSLKELNNDKTASLINDNYASAEAIATNLDNDIINHKNDMLYGIPYALKDLIATDNIKTTCGSKLFENFIPDYNASVYQSLLDSNSILTGKSNMDEFAMGGTGLYSSYGDVCNCLDNERIVGGSSSGSANLVASGILPFSIGTDTSDSVRQPASYTGTVGYIGTHGIAPTYGVLPYDSDDDDIGVFSNYVADAAIVAQNISKTEKCNTDFFNNLNYAENGNFAVIKNIDKSLYNDAKNAYTECLDKIKNFGNINYINISDDLLNSLGEIASCCDHNAAYHSFSNLKYFIYGNDTNYNDPNKNEYLKKENINKLAPQVKRRIAAGACLELKKYKKLILEKIENYREEWKKEWNNIIGGYDGVILPGASSVAPKITNVNNNETPSTFADDLIVLANIGGDPSISLPYKKIAPYDGGLTKMPFDINLTCKQYSDQNMFNIALSLENIFNYS